MKYDTMSMQYTVIAPFGESLDPLYVGIREFPTRKIILLATGDQMKAVESAKGELERFKIPIEIKEIKSKTLDEIFRAVKEIKGIEGEESLLINVATGDKLSACLTLSAAFVNGLKAIWALGEESGMFPILRFSYYKLISDKKLDILNTLLNKSPRTADELAEALDMSLPLLSYHLNGSAKTEGLKAMGLVETDDKKGRMEIGLTELGKLLIKGHVNI